MANEEATVEESPADRVVRKTPWWTISVGLHVLAVVVLMLLVVVAVPAEPETTEVIRLPKPAPEPPTWEPQPIQAPTPILDPRGVKDPVLVKDPDDTRQTPDDSEFEKALGNPEFVANKPFNSKAISDTIGVAGAPGGSNGGPFSGRKLKNGAIGGRSPETDGAVLNALRWLARHQAADGSWRVQAYAGECGRVHKGACTPNPESASADFDAGVTSLATLAFLGAGYTHVSKDAYDGICFGTVVRKALQWIVAQQDGEGFVGPRTGHKEMYNHAIASLALAEAYGLTGSSLFKANAQKAIDALVAAQNPGRGWRYSGRPGDNDTSVTGWVVMAFKSAEISGLLLPPSAYAGARAWLDEVTEDSYGRAGYTHRGTGKVYCAHNQHFDHQEAMTAIAVMSRIFMDRSADARVRSGAALLVRQPPSTQPAQIDFYAWYYAALALFQFDGPGGPHWSKWNSSLVDALVKPQNGSASGCKFGSWEPVDRWSCEGGRVYATAVNALTLEVYYRYDLVLGTKKR